MKTQSKKINVKIIIYSLIAFGFIALMFLVNWMFIIGAVAMGWLNQKELMRNR